MLNNLLTWRAAVIATSLLGGGMMMYVMYDMSYFFVGRGYDDVCNV